MFTITFIDGAGAIRSIVTPSKGIAFLVSEALHDLLHNARVWRAGKLVTEDELWLAGGE